MSADDELGYVYLPIETPTGDYYGGHRRAITFSPKVWSASTRARGSASGITSLFTMAFGIGIFRPLRR
jgi:hypothetical protein